MKALNERNTKEQLFFVGYFLLGLTDIVIGNSYLFGEKRFIICKIVQYLSAAAFVAAFCAGKYRIKELLVRLITTALAFLVTLNSHSIGFGLCSLAMVSSMNIDTDKILKCNILNNMFFGGIVVIPALLGFIPDEIHLHNGMEAHSLGFAYYSNLPSLVFMMTLELYWLAKTKREESIVLLFSLPAQIVVYKVSTLRLTFFLYILFLFVALCEKLYNHRKKPVSLKVAATCMFPAACVATYMMSFCVKKNNLIAKLDRLLNNRLGYNYEAFQFYKLRLFGQKIETFEEGIDHSYFYVDSGYVFCLLSYGVLFFCLLLALYTFLASYSVDKNQTKLTVLCLVICAHSIINNVMFNVALNPLPMIAFNLMWDSFESWKEQIQKRWNRKYTTAQ